LLGPHQLVQPSHELRLSDYIPTEPLQFVLSTNTGGLKLSDASQPFANDSDNYSGLPS